MKSLISKETSIATPTYPREKKRVGMNRRKFLFSLGGTLALSFITGKIWIKRENGRVTGYEDEYNSEYIRTASVWLEQVYGLKMFTGPRALDRMSGTFYEYLGNKTQDAQENFSYVMPVRMSEALTKGEMEIFLSTLIEDSEGITKYPTDFFRRNSIKGVRFVKNLITEGNVFSCCYSNGNDGEETVYSGGKVDGVESVVTVSVRNEDDEQDVIGHFDHECNHLVDVNDEFWGSANIVKSDDKEWASLNGSDDFEYSDESYEEYMENVSSENNNTIHDYRFVKRYGRRNAKEDMATYAEVIFSSEKYALYLKTTIELEQSTDKWDQFVGAVRRSKIAYLKAWYHVKSGGKMDKKYWDELHVGTVSKSRFLSESQIASMPLIANYVATR